MQPAALFYFLYSLLFSFLTRLLVESTVVDCGVQQYQVFVVLALCEQGAHCCEVPLYGKIHQSLTVFFCCIASMSHVITKRIHCIGQEQVLVVAQAEAVAKPADVNIELVGIFTGLIVLVVGHCRCHAQEEHHA